MATINFTFDFINYERKHFSSRVELKEYFESLGNFLSKIYQIQSPTLSANLQSDIISEVGLSFIIEKCFNKSKDLSFFLLKQGFFPGLLKNKQQTKELIGDFTGIEHNSKRTQSHKYKNQRDILRIQKIKLKKALNKSSAPDCKVSQIGLLVKRELIKFNYQNEESKCLSPSKGLATGMTDYKNKKFYKNEHKFQHIVEKYNKNFTKFYDKFRNNY